MQIDQLAIVFERYADALGASGARPSAIMLLAFSRILQKAGSTSTQKLIAAISAVKPDGRTAGTDALGLMEPTLSGLIAVLKEAGASKPVLTDVKLILDLIHQHSELSVSDLESLIASTVVSASTKKANNGSAPVDSHQLVDGYVLRLDHALGNDTAFRAVYRELGQDKRIGQSEAVEIVSKFFVRMPPSTSRPKALQKILYRHEKLMQSRAAAATIG